MILFHLMVLASLVSESIAWCIKNVFWCSGKIVLQNELRLPKDHQIEHPSHRNKQTPVQRHIAFFFLITIPSEPQLHLSSGFK